LIEGREKTNQLRGSIADILKQFFREGNTVARIGSDDFTLFFPDFDVEKAEMLKNRINEVDIKHNQSSLKETL